MAEVVKFSDGVFFTGHRPNALGGWDEDNDTARDVKKWLYQAIERAYKKGKKTFITGMAVGVDIWAGEAVLALKDKYHDIRLIAAVPYATQADRWADFNKKRWRRLIEECDEMHIIFSDPPAKSPKFEFAKRLNGRNAWMVDAAVIGIAVRRADTARGGTVNCLKYASKQKKSVLVYHPDTKEEVWENRT